MFEKYFVTCHVAVALKAAGFDEPCMAAWEYYENELSKEKRLHIDYSNVPTNPEIYSESIRSQLLERPGLFEPRRKNSQLSIWLHAAPLYEQVFDWLMAKGLYLHTAYLPTFVGECAIEAKWGCYVYNKDLKLLWPENIWPHDGLASIKDRIFSDKRDAMDQAIMEAIKLSPNNREL